MQKEIIIAIIFGSALGLVVAFGIWKADGALKKQDTSNSAQDTEKQSDNNQNPETLDLSLAKPAQQAAISESPTQVTGVTKANSFVLVSGEDGDQIVKSDNKGEFSAKIELTGGINQIMVSVFDYNGQSKSQNLLVVFSTSFGDETTKTPTASDEATTEQKVKEKLEMVSNNPISYIGTVTDKTESSFQIRSIDGEIKQISVTEGETTYVNNIKEPKDIEFSDLAIGDFIAAVGFPTSDENGVLSAKRIIVSSPIEEPNRKIFYGQVTQIDSKNLTLSGGDQEYKISLSKKPSVLAEKDGEIVKSKIGNIEKGNTLILVAVQSEKSLDARTILTTSID
jgi:hypothetical protein